MEGNFRNALIIISAIAIVAIFIHGFWTIRKNKNPYKLKTKMEKVDPIARGFDGSGFDQDGIGEVRIVESSGGKNAKVNEHTLAESIKQPVMPDIEETSVFANAQIEPDMGDFPTIDFGDQSSFETVEQLSVPHVEALQQQVHSEAKTPTKADVRFYQEPVIRPKPVSAQTIQLHKPKVRTITKKEAIKRNQMEINFGNDLEPGNGLEFDDTPAPTVEPSVESGISRVDPEVLIVSVVMPEGEFISGAQLLPTLLTLGMKYGDMDIFHRHQDNAGNGKVTFSLANMMNPGTFDLDSMETFTSQGVSLFMTLPNAGNAFEVFEQMLRAAKQLALEFRGQLLDDKRSVMTKQTEQHYTSKIREFERKSRISLN